MSLALYRQVTRLQRWIFALFFLLIVAILAAVIGWTRPAKADDPFAWIHHNFPMCCDHRDCKVVHAFRSNGHWMVEWEGHMTPYTGTIRSSPVDQAIACGTPSFIRCLFITGGTA